MDTTLTADADADLRALYLHLMAGWNRGDSAAFAAAFADDGHLVGFDGTHLQGRTEIEAFHRPLFDTWLKGTRLVGEVTGVRLLAPGVALLHASGGTIAKGKTQPATERDSVQTLVAVHQDGRWQLAAFQNTRRRPMGKSSSGTVLWLLSDWLWKVVAPAA